MSRFSRVLLLVLAGETLLGGFLVVQRLRTPLPPQPDWAVLEGSAADRLRTAAAACTTAEDWRRLGEGYMAVGCFPEAEACHRIACELAPDDPLFARQWGFALERLGLLEQANAQYRRVLDLGAKDAAACRYFLGRNHLRAENPAEARGEFTAGRSLAANRYELARLEVQAGEFDQAEALVRGVAEDQPGTLQVQHLLYRSALERGDLRQAAHCADRARHAPWKLQTPFDEEASRIVEATKNLALDPRWAAVREEIAAGRLDEAERLLAEVGRDEGGDLVLELQAEIAVRRERFEAARKLLEEHLERNGPTARVLARIGDVFDVAGKAEPARDGWLRAADLGTGVDLKATHHQLAQSFARAGDKHHAEQHLARGHYFVGRDLLKFGYIEKSIPYFAAAVRHDPSFAAGWFHLGEAYRLMDRNKEAEAAYRSCLRLEPDHGRADAALALLLDAPKK